MDDLDHSMHISDHDWLRFFEESEKCCLLHASLACPDSSGLSDADDPDFTTQTCAPTKEHQAGEDSEEPGFVEEEGSIVQCSSDVDGKGGSGPKSEHEPVMKNALDGDSLNPAEKERWFVSVNGKQPAQQLAPATVPVVKKKRKQKKICKMDCTHKDKANTIKKGKLPEQKCSNTRLETNVNTTYIESSRKSDSLDHLDKENNSESINVKSDSNEDRSYDTMSTQEICRKSAHIQLNTGLSCKESTFALQKTSDPNEIKSDTCNESTKYSKTLDSVFIHEKDRDESSEGSQTKLTMDLTCLQDSSIDDSEIKMERTCLIYSSSQEKMHNMVKENTKTGTFNNLDTINQTRSYSSGAIQEECSKIKTWTCFGASCKEDSLDLTLGNTDEPERDSDKPIDNPVTYHTNSIESDDFADYETFSSSSYDSETYHSAVEDPGHLSLQNSPCNLSACDNGDSLTDRRMQFTNGCFKQDDGLSLVKLSQIVPPAKPSADTTPNHNSTCSSGTDSPALCISVDTRTFADNSLDSLGGDQPESSPQRDVTMESPEAYAKSTGNSQPVYAISAFWDEMEKLTINDILQIRMGRCMLPIEEAVITDDVETTCTDNASTEIVDSINRPESAFLDTADSDYYSKPDRSSCDFSTSDFEEEYWQFINSSRNASPDQYDKSYQSECMDYLSTGEESDDMGTPVPSEDYSGQAFCNSTVNSYDLAVPLQIRKNKSMYDIHAPKTMEDLSSQAFWDRSSSKSLKEPLKMTDGFEVVTPIVCLADEQYQISFPEVFEYLFDDNKAKCEAMSVSVYGLQGNYASPMTDYTFCTATNDLPLMPYNEGPIPIFSCSRPTVRELTFPKPGSIFLGTNYTTMKDVSPIQIVSRSILRAMDCKHIDRSYCFTQDLTSLYSIKRICFLDKGSYAWRDQAEDEEKPVDVTDSNVTVVGEGGVLSVTPKIFKEAALWQISMEKNQMPADYQSIFSTIKQSDMCLVCIAFASWVLRSSDPEAADAWKAALLANVSALSAIQYLRHYMKKKTSPPDE